MRLPPGTAALATGEERIAHRTLAAEAKEAERATGNWFGSGRYIRSAALNLSTNVKARGTIEAGKKRNINNHNLVCAVHYYYSVEMSARI